MPAPSTADQAVPSQCRIVAGTPTAHTSAGPLPHTDVSPSPTMTLPGLDQLCPSQWKKAPLAPAAHASLGPEGQTAVKPSAVPVGKDAHVVPSQCIVEPTAPTAQTSSFARPATAERSPVPAGVQSTPSQWTKPPLPTVQTSSGALPQTPRKNGFAITPTGATPDQAWPSQCTIESSWPTVQTSSFALPQIPLANKLPLAEVAHAWPSQWAISPLSMLSSMAQTSSGLLPQTPANLSSASEGSDRSDHARPSQWRTVPKAPTAQTSSGAVPQVPRRSFVVPLSTGVHVVPFPWTIVPPAPTAQRSFAPAPHRPKIALPCGFGLLQHQSSTEHPGFAGTRVASNAGASNAGP